MVCCWRKYDSYLLMKSIGSVLPSKRGKSSFWNLGGRSVLCLLSDWSLLPDDAEACSFFRSAMATFIAVISADRFCNNLARSAMVDSPMVGGIGVDAGEGGGLGSVAACDGGAVVVAAVGRLVVAGFADVVGRQGVAAVVGGATG
ncbi:hypothetical protein GUJ93_ZPchr0005g15281 [Zizania palustris]|uniref:Uncharacterized protein n=1 Tax=Zizania palustris TaxID=103762 RepID=A0A8J5S591_ZIZPA|nr:hypothetical protein GUJ93_ZPchr0005g15281 [Zizania palustris]